VALWVGIGIDASEHVALGVRANAEIQEALFRLKAQKPDMRMELNADDT
jgi:hypothetical protein